jgi:YVTN family beta-propeller protein
LNRAFNRTLSQTLISLVTLLMLQPAVFAGTETKIAVGRNPDFVAVNSTTNTIYSSNSTQGTVSVIDGATNTPAATISVGGLPQGIAVNPATNQIYVALFNGLSSTVSVIAGGSNTVVTSIPVPGAEYVAVNAATNRIYTSNSDNTVGVIDGASNTVVATISFSSVLEGLAVDATRNLVYVAVVGAPPTIGVINGATNAVVNTFTVSKGLFLVGVAVDPSLNQIYASDTSKMELFVIDGATGSVSATIDLTGAGDPKYVALGTGHQVLVSDSSPGRGRLFFVNGSTKTLTGSTFLTYDPWGVAVNSVTREIYVALSAGTFVSAIAP